MERLAEFCQVHTGDGQEVKFVRVLHLSDKTSYRAGANKSWRACFSSPTPFYVFPMEGTTGCRDKTYFSFSPPGCRLPLKPQRNLSGSGWC